MKRFIYFILCFFILVLLIPGQILFPGPQKEQVAVPGKRSEILLNGDWEAYHTTGLSRLPPQNNGEKSPVPHLYYSDARGGSRYTWYSRSITIPQSWENQRIFIYLTGARYNPSVFINNQLCGSQLDGWIPFEVEISEFVVPGNSYTLSVRCQDWGATFETGYTLPEDASSSWDDLRGMPKGKILAPIGGLFAYYGIWDDVFLLTKPRAYLYDVAIDSSVRKNTLTIKGSWSYKKTSFYVEAEVLDKDKVVLSLTSVKTGSDGKWILSSPSPGLHYWSPENPYLYTLKVYLKGIKDNSVMDTFQTRFGFRELWAEGPDFYLNGIKQHLLASSGWPVSYYQKDEDIRSSLEKMKQGNNKAFRFHTQPWQSKWLAIADEVGILIIEEGALWCDWNGGYAYQNNQFWKNTEAHLEGMVKRDRNHPSLVMWSLENEILHCGACQFSPDVEEKLMQLGQKVKQLDPGHLITYEADLDPGGIADVIGLHYPHEMPDYTDYPNTADWLDQPVVTGTGGGLMGSREKEFSWDRKKPLYIGEYLWIPYQDFSPGTVFFGDDAYINLEDYKLKAKALSWEYQTLAYRRAGVSGMCPWTFTDSGGIFSTDDILFQTQKEVYEPVAAFPRDVAVHFFAGKKVLRTIDLFNDSVFPHSLTLRCTLQDQGTVYEKTFLLNPGDFKEVPVPVTLPDTKSLKKLLFSIDLFTGSEKVHSSSRYFNIYKKQSLNIPPGYTLLLYNPGNDFSKKVPGVPFVKLSALSELTKRNPDSDILIIGPYTFKEKSSDSSLPVIGRDEEDLTALYTFAKNGGRVLILEQETLLRFSGGMTLVPHASTLTFPVNSAHPLFSGLSRDDFRFWQPVSGNDKNYVTRMEMSRPAGYGGKALVVSGGIQGIDHSPVVELPLGEGRIIFLQALAGTKYDTEPIAHIILQNALDYLASSKPRKTKTVVLSQENTRQGFTATLEKIGVSFTHYNSPVTTEDIEDAPLVILHGGGSAITSSASALQEYLYSPGKKNTLYWHLPEKESFEQLKHIFGIPHLSLEKMSGHLTFRDMNQPLFQGICREDLVFIDKQTWSSSGRGIVIDPEIIQSAVSIKTEPENSVTYEIEEWTLSGQLVYVANNKKEVVFATNGAAIGNIHVDKPGIYPVALNARGDQADGGWPLARISVNGNPEAFLLVNGTDPALYSTMVELPGGDVLIEIAFINDLYSQGQDRNLTADSLLLAKEPVDTGTIQFLTLPAGVAECRINKSSRVIIDTIRWHENEKNRVKGMRYASVLMANMGASFLEPAIEPEWISADYFSRDGEIPYYTQSEGLFTLYTVGTIKAEFLCAREASYSIFIRAYSTEVNGGYSRIRVIVDGTVIGEIEIRSPATDVFPAGSCFLGKGTHTISIAYINDLYQDGGDRNLFFQGTGFK